MFLRVIFTLEIDYHMMNILSARSLSYNMLLPARYYSKGTKITMRVFVSPARAYKHTQ